MTKSLVVAAAFFAIAPTGSPQPPVTRKTTDVLVMIPLSPLGLLLQPPPAK